MFCDWNANAVSPPDGAETKGGNGDDGHAAKTAKIRILSYNVLGPSHGLAPKHDHCPIPVRTPERPEPLYISLACEIVSTVEHPLAAWELRL